MIVASIPLEELLACSGNTLDAFGGGDGDAARVTLADYLARRLHTSIFPGVCSNVTIKTMGVGRHCWKL